MLYRVVISHNQTEYLDKFKSTLNTLVVLDAMTIADSYACGILGYGIVAVPSQGNRSLNRNLGLFRILETCHLNDNDIIEFFDGDRHPIEYSEKRIQELMDGHDLDGILYACAGIDSRVARLNIATHSTVIVDTGTLCNPFYSCGFALRVSAVKKVLSYNNGNLFEPRLSSWGCEDQYLGIICDYLGLRIALTTEILIAGDVGGDQHLHKNYRESLQKYIDLLRTHNLPIRSDYRANVPVE